MNSAMAIDHSLRSKISLPQFVGVLSDSIALVVYRDSSVAKPALPAWLYYAVIVNAKRSQVCLDMTLPEVAGREAKFALHADTLEVLAGSRPAMSDCALTRLRYRIAIASCTWLGVQPGI